MAGTSRASAVPTTGLVSCIVPACNAERFLAQTLDSIVNQTHRPIEIIVCDDGSSDGTGAVAAAYGDRVRYLRQPNAGPAAARTLGVAASTGDYLAFLDADDLWTPDKIARQLSRFDARSELDFSVCHVQNSVDPARLAPLPGFTTVALLVRRASFDRIGPFDSTLRHSSETEWFLRARDAGAIGECLPDVLVHRRLHGTNRSRQHATRSRDEYLHLVKAALDRRRVDREAGA